MKYEVLNCSPSIENDLEDVHNMLPVTYKQIEQSIRTRLERKIKLWHASNNQPFLAVVEM